MTTSKDFVLICIQNEINRYKEANETIENENAKQYNLTAIKILGDFYENIKNNQ